MDSVALFDKTSQECSKLITQNYSTSFTLGIKLFDKKYHTSIYAIYGFVRYADEIVDTFLKCDVKTLLDKFKNDTFEAIETGLSLNPVLHAFQIAVTTNKIDKELIDAFLHSMEMDIYLKKYDECKYREYVYGSAEVVGLMCLRVFCEGDESMYECLKEPARKLGAAFQKVNFLRDMKSDYEERGRVYFPGVDYDRFEESIKVEIEKEIENDFEEAVKGINQLPEGARAGVRIAYIYYRKLFEKIKNLPPEVITKERVRIPDFQKIAILLSEKYLYFVMNILILIVPLIFSFESRVSYWSTWYALFPAIWITAAFFILWDVIFTRKGVWRFNTRYLIGSHCLSLPIEEWMFFFTVPYACLFIYESLNYFFPQDIFQPMGKPFFYSVIPAILGLGVVGYNKLYTSVVSVVTVAVILAHMFVFEERLLGRLTFALLVHYIPFFICNGILTGGGGTEEPVVIYNESHFLNVRIGTIPLEDTVYSMALLVMNISLLEWFKDSFAK